MAQVFRGTSPPYRETTGSFREVVYAFRGTNDSYRGTHDWIRETNTLRIHGGMFSNLFYLSDLGYDFAMQGIAASG